MKKVISKGYTITVISWENDGDNYRTKSITVDNIEEAKAISEMCETIFISCNNGESGIGNMMDDEGDDAKEVILPFMKENPVLWEGKKNPSDEELIGICMEINYNLMGGSECYFSRVMERCDVTYSKEDIFLEIINFK